MVAVCAIALTFLIASCKKSGSSIDSNASPKFTESQGTPTVKRTPVKSTGKFKNDVVQGKVKERFGSLKIDHSKFKKVKKDARVDDEVQEFQVDLESATAAYYDNTNVYGLIYPQYTSPSYTVSFVTFGQDNLLADMAMYVATEDLGGGVSRTQYYDLDYNLVGQIDNDNGVWTNGIGYPPPPSYSSPTKSWWSRWTSCASYALNGMSNQASALGVACIFAAGPCGISLVVGCAGMATFF